MPYIGKQLSNGNYLKLDDISSQFNGSKVAFNLTNGGSAYYPGSELSILVSVGGVIQEPESAYQISNDEITFANAPTAQDSFFCVVLGDAIGINVPGNNTVNGAQMAKPFNYDGGLLYLDDSNNKVGINSTSPSVALDIIGDLNVSGTITGIVTSGGSGISTFYNLNIENNATIDGNLTVNGTTTTLDTVLTEVDKLEVAANNSTVGAAITQSGSGDIFNLYDGSTEVFSVADGGAITATGAITANNFVGGLPITSGADNRVITASSASAIQGESNLTFDGTNLLLSTTDGKIQLKDSNSYIQFIDADKNFKFTNAWSAGEFTFHVDGGERLRIQNDGKVGIATASPATTLDVQGDVAVAYNATHALRFYTQPRNNWSSITNTATDSNANLSFRTSQGEAMYMSYGKLVGIGTNNPGEKLQIDDGHLRLKSSNTSGYKVKIGNVPAADNDFLGAVSGFWENNEVAIVGFRSGLDTTNKDDGMIFFGTSASGSNPSTRMTIRESGKIGINVTSPEELLDLGESNQQNIKVGQRGYLGQAYSTAATILGHSVKAKTTGTTASGMIVTETNSGGGAPSAIRQVSGTIQFHTAGSGTADADFDSERLRITSDGELLIGGYGSVIEPDGYASHVQVTGTATDAGISILRYSNNSGGPTLLFGKSRGTSIGSFTKVQDGDSLGKIEFYGTDTGWESSASVRACADGEWYSGSVGSEDNTDAPGRLEFHTTPDGADNMQERLRITSAGHLKIPNGGKIELGGAQSGSGSCQFIHDGTDTFIQNKVGDLRIANNVAGDVGGNITIQAMNGENSINCVHDAQVELSFNGSQKFATSTTGISVTGEVAATQDYPNQRPALDFNFIRTKTLDSIFTYQRMGAASFVNEQGLVELVGDNTPRFDHDPVTRECKGLLIEESTTNRIFPSSDWGEDYWTINNSGSLSRETHTDDIKDPAGTYTATKLVTLQGNTNAKDIWWTATDITYTNGVKFAVSCFARSTSGLVLQLRPRGQGSNKAWANYNLSTGAVGSSGGTTLVSTKIEKYPNGWYRCSLVFTGSGNSSCSLGTLIMDSPTATEAASHTGDGSKSIYLWGAQVEQSNTVTSYIPTAAQHYNITQPKTRGEDDLRITGTEFTDFYNPMESTICMSFTHLDTSANIGTNARIYRFRSSNTSSDTRIDYLSHPYYHPFVSEDGNQPTGGTGLDAGTLLYEGQVNKTAVKVKENDFGSCLNGGSVAVDTNGGWNPSNAFNELSLGSSNGSATTLLMGHIQRFTYYPVALPDNQLKTLTS